MTDDAELKNAKLSAQWPKTCGCGKVYDRRANYRGARATPAVPSQWNDLPFAYNYTDKFATQEGRHCSCGSTLVIYTVIHDLSEE